MDPYRLAYKRMAAHRRAVEGRGWLLRLLVGIVAVGALLPLVRSSFLAFLDKPPAELADGVAGLAMRVGLLMVSGAAIEVYGALVRSDDRRVLDLLPIDPRRVVVIALQELIRTRMWAVLAIAALCAPVALASPLAYAALIVVIVGSALLGVAAAALVNLLAVDAATSPRWAPVLDVLRGHNPREQAAFLYAPGLVLALAGLVVILAAQGAGAATAGSASGAAMLALPFLAAIPCALAVPALAERAWFRAGAVVADIDARYALHEHPDEARRVYLDWAVRFLPADVGRWALQDLRHGWRGRRGYITSGFLLGVVLAAIAWTDEPDGPARAAMATVVTIWGLGVVGALLDGDDPQFLRAWLPYGSASRAIARAIVVLAWVQVPAVVPAVAAGLRQGLPAAGLVLGSAELAALGAALVAALLLRFGDTAPRVYVPVAAVAAGAMAALIGGFA